MSAMNSINVDLKAATPDDVKSSGMGWVINAGFAETPFGTMLIADGLFGIFYLSFIRGGRMQSYKDLISSWPSATWERNDDQAGRWAEKIFSSTRLDDQHSPHIQLFLNGTEFQIKVWQALIRIPAGDTVSYSRLAAMIGHPKAARAVGGAVGRNPVAYLIPCHRVVCADGTLGGYRWGVKRKQALLLHERESGRSFC